MVSLHSGSPKDKELVIIETAELTCIIKGSAAHPQYNKLRKHMSFKVEDAMQFHCRAESLREVEIHNVLTDQLEVYDNQSLLPIFFENGRYEIIIIPKENEQLTFYHEFPLFRNAVQKLSRSNYLTGTLHFQNEVGLTSFEIHGEQNQVLLTVVLEVFPTKLDYKKDYKALLNEVNEEIYNLAYHFIKRTYLQGSAKIYKEPSLTEFYRLIEQHFDRYIRAIERIERASHHRLSKIYQEVRGDRLRKQDAQTLSYLRRNANKFIDVPSGLSIHGRTVMPTKGLLIKKEHSSDTYENRYVKWTMVRIGSMLKGLKRVLEKSYFKGYGKSDDMLVEKIDSMINWLDKRPQNPFWRKIGQLDRSIMSLVLQMAPDYRNVLQVYTTVSKSIVLTGEIYKISVKDIATLYEYWTFLKLGRILESKCIATSQDVVGNSSKGLFINLNKSQTTERKYEHPVTKEEIILKYQFDTKQDGVPTVRQKPDSMLSIGKKGRVYQYQYIFDAKYRLDLETNPLQPGPMQDDINTMHRYRDSIVVNTEGRYERTAFGAYVLFPWHDERNFKSHRLYESIDSVNIGGFPFLPNATKLVEDFIDNLLNKSPEELQEEGILPKGTSKDIDESYSVERVLIGIIYDEDELQQLLQKYHYTISIVKLPERWERISGISIYEANSGSIIYYAEIAAVEIEDENVVFKVNHWKQKLIEGKGYVIKRPTTFNKNHFLQADFLADMYIKKPEEEILWKIVQRISNNIEVELNTVNVEEANKVVSFTFNPYKLVLHHEIRQLNFQGPNFNEKINMDLILDNESYIFKRLTELIYPLN